MQTISTFVRRHAGILSTMYPRRVLVACAALAAVLIVSAQRFEAAPARPTLSTTALTTIPPPALPGVEIAPTFASAAESLRTGRYADAYGRFVQLADEGDIDAGRIALVMHRFGPKVFGSTWDATVEQVADWTYRSEVAAQKELARLRAVMRGAAAADAGTDPQTALPGRVDCAR